MISMIIGYTALLLFSLILLYIRRKNRGSYYSVTSFLFIPILFVTGVQIILCNLMGLEIPPIEYWLWYILFFVVVFLFDSFGEKLADRLTIGGVPVKRGIPTTELYGGYVQRLKVLSILAAAFALAHLLMIMSHYSNIYQLVQPSVQSQYGSGINYYVRLFLMLCTVYYWGCSKITKTNLLLGLICFLPNALTFVKSIILLSILSSLTIRLIKHEFKISLKMILVVFVIGIIVFYGVNMVEMGIYDINILKDIETYKYIGVKMGGYFVSGVQSFAQNLIDKRDAFLAVDNVTLAPFVSLLSKIGIGESYRAVTTISQVFWYSEQLGRNVGSNVNGYVGTLYLFSGVLLGNILNAIWVFVASFLERCYIESDDIRSALAGLFCGAFTLGWFDYYFSQTFWVYLIIITAVFHAVLKAISPKVKKYYE